MDLTLLMPAALVAIFTYLGAKETPWLIGKTGGFYLVGRPLVAGLIVGLVFGDVQTAMICAVAVQVLFLANSSDDVTMKSDITMAAYGGIALAIATNGQAWSAVILAYLIGKLCHKLFFTRHMKLNEMYHEQLTTAMKAGKMNDMTRYHVWQPQLINFLFKFVPMFVLIFLGAPFLNWLFEVMPLVITDSLSAIGWILPVLGLVTMMSHLVKADQHLIFALIGFLAAGALGIAIGWLFAIGLVGMVVYLIFFPKKNDKTMTNMAKKEKGGV